jgi:hypothetical protein
MFISSGILLSCTFLIGRRWCRGNGSLWNVCVAAQFGTWPRTHGRTEWRCGRSSRLVVHRTSIWAFGMSWICLPAACSYLALNTSGMKREAHAICCSDPYRLPRGVCILKTRTYCVIRYKVMLDCWNLTPEQRPSFAELVERTVVLLNDQSLKVLLIPSAEPYLPQMHLSILRLYVSR